MHAHKGASEAPRTRFRACKTSKFSGGVPPDPPCTIYNMGPAFCICPGPLPSSRRPCPHFLTEQSLLPPSATLAWFTSGGQCSRLQLPLKLAWAVTIHKAQGLTLDKVVIDVGKKEFSCEQTFVACSRVHRLTDMLFDPPFPFEHVATLPGVNACRKDYSKMQDFDL